MTYTTLGKTGLRISTVGLGAWAIGGAWQYGWGAQDDNVSLRTIKTALENGVNWIDTAPVYGLGHSEKVVGRFLKACTQKPLIFTKCGLLWNSESKSTYSDISPASIQKEVNDSLMRLGIEAIDLYQIHWPKPSKAIEAAWETLVQLREQGKVRHIGVSNFSLVQLERAETIAPVETLQPNYSLLEQSIQSKILPWCQKKGIGVIAYSPMASGLLSGTMTRKRIASLPDDDWRKSKNDHFKEPKLTRNLECVEFLKKIGEKYDCGSAEIAIAWVLSNKSVHGAITGMRHPSQVATVTKASSIVLDKADLQSIDAFFMYSDDGLN